MRSKWLWRVVVLACVTVCAVAPGIAMAARNAGWRVAEPEELVAWIAFDPGGVSDRLPSRVRFVTIGDLAEGGVGWAAAHLRAFPGHSRWGVSFAEIVRAGTFMIDGREPRWPKDGAAALWCARVAAADSTDDLGPGQPYLVLDFWVPDSAYVTHMRGHGYFARFGDARLRRARDGAWRGSVHADGLDLTAIATPSGPGTGGADSAGAQAFFPPAHSGIPGVVRVRFAGHRVRATRDVTWRMRGAHPLAGTVVLEPPSFEWGYELEGAPTPR